jgi:hypothetical protein
VARNKAVAFGQQLIDWPAVFDRLAQIQTDSTAEPLAIPDEKWTIEPEPVPLGGGNRGIEIETAN